MTTIKKNCVGETVRDEVVGEYIVRTWPDDPKPQVMVLRADDPTNRGEGRTVEEAHADRRRRNAEYSNWCAAVEDGEIEDPLNYDEFFAA